MKTRVTFTIDPETDDLFYDKCRRFHLKKSRIVNELIKKWVLQ